MFSPDKALDILPLYRCITEFHTGIDKNYSQRVPIPLIPGQTSFTFELKACANGHIGLMGDKHILYEIFFSGYINYVETCAIR